MLCKKLIYFSKSFSISTRKYPLETAREVSIDSASLTRTLLPSLILSTIISMVCFYFYVNLN